LTETDWKGSVIEHAYDGLNRRISTKNRLGHFQYTTYDPANNPIRTQDFEGRITSRAFDRLNRLTDIWQPALDGEDRGRTRFTYYNGSDPETNLKSTTDPEGNLTTLEFNGRYLKTRRIDALGHDHLWEYDAAGNPTREIDEDGVAIKREFDKQDRLIAENRFIDGRTITTRYTWDLG
jgi:YD repeat-containing protein